MATFFTVCPTFILPANDGLFHDVDLSANVPPDCLAIVRIYHTAGTVGFRAKGSTDTDVQLSFSGSAPAQNQFLIPVDSNSICQCRNISTQTTAYIEGYLISDEFGWFTNAYDKLPGTTGWQDVTCSEVPSGTPFAIFINPYASGYVMGRAKGSTDSLLPPTDFQSDYQIVPLDGSKICQANKSGTPTFKLVGYLKVGTGLTNRTDKSLSTLGSYQTIDVSSGAPSDAIAAIILVIGSGLNNSQSANLRTTTNADDLYYIPAHWSGTWIIGLDALKQLSGKIQHAIIDFYLVGWLQEPSAYSYTIECNSQSSGITLKDLDLIIATISDSSVISGKDFDYIIDCMSSSSTGVFVITGGVVANTYSYVIDCNSESSLNALRGLHLMLSVDSSSGGVTESGENINVNSQSSVIVAGLFDPYCNSQSSVIVLLHRHLPIFVDTYSSILQAKRPQFPISSNSQSSVLTDYELITVLVDYACYLLNTDTKRTYQFGTYEFRGIGRFNKKLIGIRNNKIYDLETVATHDDGVDISSYFEIETDFGMPNKKGFRSIFTQDNRVRVTITDRNSNAVVADVTQDEFRALPRDLIDKAFTIKVENIDGEQITIRRLQGTLNILDIKGG